MAWTLANRRIDYNRMALNMTMLTYNVDLVDRSDDKPNTVDRTSTLLELNTIWTRPLNVSLIFAASVDSMATDPIHSHGLCRKGHTKMNRSQAKRSLR